MPNSVKERIALARGHVRRGDLAAAEAIYTAIADEFPSFADVQNELGLLYHERGDFELAQQSFLRALSINPAYTEAALHLSITWNDLGRYEDARRVYREAVERARDVRDGLEPPVAQKIATLFAEIGDIFALAGQPTRAAKAYRDALDLGPGYHDIRLRLAQALQDANDLTNAIIEIQRVIEASPDLMVARVALGLAQFASGNRTEAASAWRAVLERDPKHPRALMYLRLAGETV